MNDAHAKTAAAQPAPARLTRTFHAPRELVFKAWGSVDHVKRWFAPKPFTVPQATVDMRVGGPFELVMLGPDGVEHWVRGKFIEVSKFGVGACRRRLCRPPRVERRHQDFQQRE